MLASVRRAQRSNAEMSDFELLDQRGIDIGPHIVVCPPRSLGQIGKVCGNGKPAPQKPFGAASVKSHFGGWGHGLWKHIWVCEESDESRGGCRRNLLPPGKGIHGDETHPSGQGLPDPFHQKVIPGVRQTYPRWPGPFFIHQNFDGLKNLGDFDRFVHDQ